MSDWADIMSQIAESSAARHEQHLNTIRDALPDRIDELPNKSSEWLVDFLTSFQGWSDPREGEIISGFRNAVASELKSRLA